MYDVGNELRLRVNGVWTPFPLDYKQDCVGASSEPVRPGDASYATCKSPGPQPFFAATFVSPTAAINGFRVSGNLGADGTGQFLANLGDNPLVSTNSSEAPVYGYYKQTFGTSTTSSDTHPDPSVNHLVMVRRMPSAVTDVGTTTDSDMHQLLFAHGAYQVYYLMWAGSSAKQYTLANFQSILDTVGHSCFDDPPDPLPTPPRYDVSNRACNNPCMDGFCSAFVNTACSVIAQPPRSCDCTGCCLAPGEASSPPPPSPPVAPAAPPPLPAACDAPCAGSTCGAFSGGSVGLTSCSDFTDMLGCDCGGCCATEANLQCVTSKWPASLPSLFAFTDGYAGRSITDGGNDMYDGGNYLNVKVGGRWIKDLPYTNDCEGAFPTVVAADISAADAVYSTCKLLDGFHTVDTVGEATAGTLFSTVVTSSTNKIEGFIVSGNLGADNEGHQSYHTFTGPRGTHGFFKQVYGAQHDPSVNHLIITRSALKAGVRTATTDSDWQHVEFAQPQGVVYYLLWAGLQPSNVPNLQVSHLPRSPQISPDPTRYTLRPTPLWCPPTLSCLLHPSLTASGLIACACSPASGTSMKRTRSRHFSMQSLSHASHSPTASPPPRPRPRRCPIPGPRAATRAMARRASTSAGRSAQSSRSRRGRALVRAAARIPSPLRRPRRRLRRRSLRRRPSRPRARRRVPARHAAPSRRTHVTNS